MINSIISNMSFGQLLDFLFLTKRSFRMFILVILGIKRLVDLFLSHSVENRKKNNLFIYRIRWSITLLLRTKNRIEKIDNQSQLIYNLKTNFFSYN